MGPCRVFTYYKNIYCSINPSEDVENLGRNTLVFESDWDKLPHLRKVAKSLNIINCLINIELFIIKFYFS